MEPLLEACARYNLSIAVVNWDDPAINWSKFSLVILRSPWSYTQRLQEFLSWCHKVSAVTRIENPVPLIEWSLDKHYLQDLAKSGAPIVPTRFIDPDGPDIAMTISEFIKEQNNCLEIVAKPSIGAYSKDVRRFKTGMADELQAHIEMLHAKGTCALIQPYYSSIDLVGETDLIFFNGQFSHAIRKDALLEGDGTVNVPTSKFRTERTPDATEIRLAAKSLSIASKRFNLTRNLLYARVDLLRDNDGNPVILEMEIAEPSLSLPNCQGSADVFAAAINSFVDELVEVEA